MNPMDYIRKTVLRRRQAYRSLFRPDDLNLTRAAMDVLADLRQFCRATSTPAIVSPVSRTIDPIATGIAIGRLEVWHRITQHIHVSDADLYNLLEKEAES
jgi:hypothetical protein